MAWARRRMVDDGARPACGATEPAEVALIAAAQACPQAFASLYARYLDPVYRYCYRRLGSREAAEDATSQVFVQALAALSRYRDGSFRSWLFTIAHHVVTDVARRGKPTHALDAGAEPIAVARSPEEVALGAESRAMLRAWLARLPDDQRQVIELRLAGLTGAEIARVLGRGTGAVKMLQYRAMTRLRAFASAASPEEAPHDQQ
jgi:RNA polymerase sigma factor (sigma-70 family)